MRAPLLVIACCACACGPRGPQPLEVGAVFSTRGSLAERGIAQLQAAKLAVDEINTAGGVQGRPLALVFRDDGSDANKAQRAADAMKALAAPVVIGASGSELTRTLVQTLGKGAVVISGSASSEWLSALSGGYVVRTCASDSGEGRLLAQRVRVRKLQKVAVLRPGGDMAIADAFRTALEGAGGEIVFESAFEPGAAEYLELVRAALAEQPEAVLLDADPISGARIVESYAAAFPGGNLPWFFTHSLESASFITAAGENRFHFPNEGVGPGTPTGQRYTRFAEAYTRAFEEPPAPGSYAANVYDAVYLAALALSRSGSLAPEAVRSALAEVSLGGVAFGPADYEGALKALSEERDVNYEGASGSVDLDAQGDTSAPYDIWSVTGGKLTLVERAIRAPL